jgi:phthalate 4,5-dioxygenase oxygenase subunit
MLSKDDNERMCRVGPGTSMGAALRRYWMPALLASELPEPDGDPVQVELLGENFVAFRDTNGKIGFLDEACCHRGASLALGRVEDCGIRCIYHGWKFAVDGSVLETPNVPDPEFKKRFKARAYAVEEAGGLLWVYLGAAEQRPPFYRWPWLSLPKSNVLTTVHLEDCNYVQIIEGLLDSTHLGLLHSDGLSRSADVELDYAKKVGVMQADLAPRMEAEETNFGFHYAALRTNSAAGSLEARLTAYVAPFTILNANGDIATIVVPVNDHRTLFFTAFWSADQKMNEEPLRSQQLKFVGLEGETLAAFGISRDTIGKPGTPTPQNRFHQDREAMRKGRTFSGLPGIIAEDVAVSVSAGIIRDRSREMLSTADVAIQRLYRTLLGIARKVENAETPVGLDGSVDDTKVIGANGQLAADQPWQALAPGHVTPSRPHGFRSAAE